MRKNFPIFFSDNVTVIHHRSKLVIQWLLRQRPIPNRSCRIVCSNSNFDHHVYIFFLVVVQEEGSRKVLVYLDIPELKVKRAFPNVFKQIPFNGNQQTLEFHAQWVSKMKINSSKSNIKKTSLQINEIHLQRSNQTKTCKDLHTLRLSIARRNPTWSLFH